jgi:hypothetical protein
MKFWTRVAMAGPDDCWEWNGYRDPGGYGRYKPAKDASPVGAHRMAWILTNGPIPAGLLVCHSCDNPPCVNPAHLFLGDNAANTADSTQKGRRARPIGSSNGYSRFTESDVREIKRAAESGTSQKAIAALYGCDPSTISYILTGKTWRHVA